MKRPLLIFVSGLLAASAGAATNPAPPTATELLDKFAATQAPIKSFIAQYDATVEFEEVAPHRWKGTTLHVIELCSDGQRFRNRARLWGRLGLDEQVSKAQPVYNSTLFDGQFQFQYSRNPSSQTEGNKRGMLTIRRPAPDSRSTTPVTAEWFGLFGGPLHGGLGYLPYDRKRIDLRLREAAAIHLRDRQELAGAAAAPCYVLEAETPHGHYTLWLDPTHSYQLAKAVVEKRPGHLIYGPGGERPADSSYHLLGSVDKVRFEQREGLWVPIEFTVAYDATGGNQHWRGNHHNKATRFVLNPGAAALGPFVPDDVPDGVYASLERPMGVSGTGASAAKGTWQKGRIVDKAGKVVFDSGLGSARMEQANPASKK